MRNKQNASRKKTRRFAGKGAYYPGGRVLRGQGGFFDDVGNFFKKAAGPVLGAIGGVANSIIPGSGMITDGIRSLIGAGAYTPVHSNAILAQPVPKVGSSSDVGISYSHEEYLGDVTGSTGWELTQFHVNPGLPEVFPWLCGVASNFQKYRIDGLVFYLRSTSSVAIASGTDLGLGTVMGGFQYNVYDKAPGSKLEFLSLSGARSGKPSEDHIFPMECDRSKNVFGNLLIRTVGVTDDQAKYDHAVFDLATVGFPGEYYLGELWVSYRVTLMAPKVESSTSTISTLPGAGNVLYAGLPACTIGIAQPPQAPTFWNMTPPLDDALSMYNSAGWSVGVASDGFGCIIIPAGTSGYFLSDSYTSGVRPPSTATSRPNFTYQVLDNSGTFVSDSTKVMSATCAMAVNEDLPARWHARVCYKCMGLPDKPMKLRPICNWNAGDVATIPYLLNLLIYRLPEKIFAADAGGATVSLAAKVQRVLQRKSAIQTTRMASVEEKSYPLVENYDGPATLYSPAPLLRGADVLRPTAVAQAQIPTGTVSAGQARYGMSADQHGGR